MNQKTKIAPGQVFGNYQLGNPLGAGGMGQVFKAHDRRDGRPVAIKFLSPSPGRTQESNARFNRESQNSQELKHPNIVQTLEAGKWQNIPFMVLEFVDGENLRNYLEKKGRLEVDEAIRITISIAMALQHAHSQGMVHRDVKPENILISKSGQVKLGDMGLVKRMQNAMDLTQAGFVIGTPNYVSPEQARAERKIDWRADLYALGATLYHLLTGQVPFVATNAMEILKLHLYGTPAHPKALNPTLPVGVCNVVMRLMAKLREDRYPSAAQAIEDMERILQGAEPIYAKPVEVWGDKQQNHGEAGPPRPADYVPIRDSAIVDPATVKRAVNPQSNVDAKPVQSRVGKSAFTPKAAPPPTIYGSQPAPPQKSSAGLLIVLILVMLLVIAGLAAYIVWLAFK